MSEHEDSSAERGVALQRQITTLVLDKIGATGFALAGSSAIREHGLTNRPTNDVDLFTTTATGPEAFADAVATAEQVLAEHGYHLTLTRSTPEFARLIVASPEAGLAVEVDFGIDWRREPPAQLGIGPVLALRDAVGSKVAAVYSRGEARDFLDLDAIRQSGRFTDEALLALAIDHDPGFDTATFARQLRWVSHLAAVETVEYGVEAAGLGQVQNRLTTWANDLDTTLSEQPARQRLSQGSLAPDPPRTRRPEPPQPPGPPGPSRDPGGPSIGF